MTIGVWCGICFVCSLGAATIAWVLTGRGMGDLEDAAYQEGKRKGIDDGKQEGYNVAKEAFDVQVAASFEKGMLAGYNTGFADGQAHPRRDSKGHFVGAKNELT